ncbi:LysR family transcriptional regulator [Klebsiella quasipneumoniae]|uniref:LysR family transcriptional regulator n=1 Tax=Klebsiella quasipneumoniae TaxID=1463165 RepID=UPI003D36F01D
MDKLRGMETFIAVVECGSFTGAASRLGLSAVMVGKYIAQLETQLATRLLERNTRRQSLTDAGRVYFDEAKRVMEQVSIAESAVERLRLPGMEGEVRWKRDAVLRCNDGYALRQAAIAGAGLLMQPEVLLADALASGSLMRVLEAWTPQPRPVHLLWRQDRRPLPKLTQFIAHLQQGMADALATTRVSE